jgi:hypothetical protein
VVDVSGWFDSFRLWAIRYRTTLDGSHRYRRPNCEFDLQPFERVAHRFTSYPEAVATTLEIAERCAGFDLTADLDYMFPEHPTVSGETQAEALERYCWESLVERYPPDHSLRAEAEARLREELRAGARRDGAPPPRPHPGGDAKDRQREGPDDVVAVTSHEQRGRRRVNDLREFLRRGR